MTEKKSPVISFKNFTFQYRAQKRPTLMGINLDIYPGERVLIAGSSGCGKSTLAGCINGLNPFSNPGECTGELTVDGVDAPKSSIFELSAHVGTVLQDPDGQFIGLTVGEDIAFALEHSCTPQNEMHEITRHAAELLADLVSCRYNLFVSGGTSSGKTTLLNALSHFIGSGERVIMIEDSAELQPGDIENIVRLECRRGNISGKFDSVS